MRDDHATVSSTVMFDLLAPGTPAVPVTVELRYDTSDPYAVVIAFKAGEEWVEWVCARDLMADGLLADAGEGDIHFVPSVTDERSVLVELNSPAGHAMFEAPAEALAIFLDSTYDLAVPGTEHLWVSVDDALAGLMPRDRN